MIHNCNDIETLKLSHKDIVSFYKERPHIDIEQSQLLLLDFISKWEIYEKTRNVTEVTQTNVPITNNPNTICIEAKKPSQDKGTLEFILNKLNPTSKIVSNKNSNICCDYIVTNHNSTKLFIENKILDQNVSEIVVDTFKKSCQTNNANGILMSQNTGIIGKEDFEI